MHTNSTSHLVALSCFQKGKSKIHQPDQENLSGFGKDGRRNTAEAISLLLVEGIQINKELDRMRVVM